MEVESTVAIIGATGAIVVAAIGALAESLRRQNLKTVASVQEARDATDTLTTGGQGLKDVIDHLSREVRILSNSVEDVRTDVRFLRTELQQERSERATAIGRLDSATSRRRKGAA